MRCKANSTDYHKHASRKYRSVMQNWQVSIFAPVKNNQMLFARNDPTSFPYAQVIAATPLLSLTYRSSGASTMHNRRKTRFNLPVGGQFQNSPRIFPTLQSFTISEISSANTCVITWRRQDNRNVVGNAVNLVVEAWTGCCDC